MCHITDHYTPKLAYAYPVTGEVVVVVFFIFVRVLRVDGGCQQITKLQLNSEVKAKKKKNESVKKQIVKYVNIHITNI